MLSANAEVLGAARALAPAGGVYLQPDARKGPNDFHVETKPKGAAGAWNTSNRRAMRHANLVDALCGKPAAAADDAGDRRLVRQTSAQEDQSLCGLQDPDVHEKRGDLGLCPQGVRPALAAPCAALLPASALGMLCVLGRGEGTVGAVGAGICLAQCAAMLGEHLLRRARPAPARFRTGERAATKLKLRKSSRFLDRSGGGCYTICAA